MKKTQVRCWPVEIYDTPSKASRTLFVPYPEGNESHDFILCLGCGTVYAVDIGQMVYSGPPLEQKLEGTQCLKCRKNLKDSHVQYPETYLDSQGTKCQYECSLEIPPDEKSTIMEFFDIYS